MRGLLFKAAVLMLLAVAYIASPFAAAWYLREAIRTSDLPTIERKVDFERVRATLRASIAEEANLLPMAVEAGAAVRPTLWQRVKSMFGTSMLDRFLDTYVTPEGLPKLYSYRETWRGVVRRAAPDRLEGSESGETLQTFWQRLKRAEFTGLTRVEIEMQARSEAARRFVSTFELRGFEWTLVGLRVLGAADKSQSIARAL